MKNKKNIKGSLTLEWLALCLIGVCAAQLTSVGVGAAVDGLLADIKAKVNLILTNPIP